MTNHLTHYFPLTSTAPPPSSSRSSSRSRTGSSPPAALNSTSTRLPTRSSEDGYARMVGGERFWEIVASHYIGGKGPKIFWDELFDGEEEVARLMQWSDDEGVFIEIDSEAIEPSEEPEPYDAAEKRLADRHGLELDDVASGD